MSKYDTKTLQAGQDVAWNDRLLQSDQSKAEGNQDVNLERGAAAEAFQKITVTQSSHGFSVGEVVRRDAGTYAEATADTEANAEVVALVVEVIDTDKFVLQQAGPANTLTGLSLSDGSRYYLQDAGGLGTSAGTVEVPILDATGSESGWLLPLGAGGGGGGASQLDDLTDVDISSAGEFDHLQHDGSTFVNVLPHTMKLVRNDTGSTISAGTLIEIHDANASTSRIRPADKDSSDSVDGVAAESIATNSEGVIKVSGTYDGVDTSGMTAGSALWLGDDGGFVDSAPTSGAVIRVAKVGIVHGSTGSIVLDLPAFETDLGDLSDVDAGSPSDGQVLTWVNANSAWEPTAASGVSDFTSLDDTPGSYSSGDAGKRVAVNSAEDALEFVDAPLQSFVIACSDESTDLSTGTAKVTFRMPYAFTVEEVRASVTTAPTGSALQADINEAGSSILSTEITIDDGDTTSEDAGTAPVVSDSALADDAEVTIDIDQVGSTTPGAGLKVTIIGRPA